MTFFLVILSIIVAFVVWAGIKRLMIHDLIKADLTSYFDRVDSHRLGVEDAGAQVLTERFSGTKILDLALLDWEELCEEHGQLSEKDLLQNLVLIDFHHRLEVDKDSFDGDVCEEFEKVYETLVHRGQRQNLDGPPIGKIYPTDDDSDDNYKISA